MSGVMLSAGRSSVKSLDLVHHPAHMGIGATRFQDSVTLPRVAPMKDLDGDAADTPLIHFPAGRAVEINGVASGKIPSVIINYISLAGRQDHEFSSDRPP